MRQRALWGVVLLALPSPASAQRTPATPRPRRLSAADSAALVKRVRDTEFRFMMDWRYLWQMDHSLERKAYHYFTSMPSVDSSTYLLTPNGVCSTESNGRSDPDPHSWAIHLARMQFVGRVVGFCPTWLDQRFPEPPDALHAIDAPFLDPRGTWKSTEQKSVMASFLKETGDSAQRLRAGVITLLDSAARLLPGDAYIAGQRVRLLVDQQNAPAALRAAAQCEADFWWCFALTGYVQWMTRDFSLASATFERARKLMPDSVRCAWEDIALLLPYSARTEYLKLPCSQRAAVNERAWWLADPLFLEKGNDRRVEHYARRTLIELHRAIEADEHFDWRENYQGPALEVMVMKWGWPSYFKSNALCPYDRDPLVSDQYCPAAWHRGNTKSLPLFDETATPFYWGPQYHLLPKWSAIVDPFSAADDAWDLAPPREWNGRWSRETLPFWDQSWWATEFYDRDAPLVPLLYQVAFFRRQHTAIIAASLNWDSVSYMYRPPNRVIAGALLGVSPTANLYGVRDTMTVARPHAMAASVPSGPSLLGLEMMPRDATGAAGRTRLGVTVPPPLSALPLRALALSDPVLLRATVNEDVPASADDMLPRMLGSVHLRNPQRVGIFWELYGLNRGDTIDVAVKITRRDDANVAQQLFTLLGIRPAGNDSLVITWKEPRPGDVVTPVANGVSIAPRGLTLNVAAMAEGRYTLDVIVQRGVAAPISSRREFFIER